MRARAIVLPFVLAALAAGCLEPERSGGQQSIGSHADGCGKRPDREGRDEDWSKEVFAANVTAEGAFVLLLPVPISPDGTQMTDWLAHPVLPAGWTVQGTTTDRGEALEVAGTGPGTAVVCAIQAQSPRGNGCCAEQFLDRSWSIPAHNDTLQVHVHGAVQHLLVTYDARSNWCGANVQAAGEGLAGWGTLPLAGDANWCE